MQFRLSGLVPVLALLPAFTVMAATTPPQDTGNMAYPQSLPSGQVKIPAPAARDTGNMAYPASPGGVSEKAATGQDTGNMATPSGRSAIGTHGMATRTAAMPMHGPMAGNPPMRPDVAPMAPDSAAARMLADAPAAAPIPYTDFDAPKPMMHKGMMHKGMMHMHHAMAKKTAAAEAPAK